MKASLNKDTPNQTKKEWEDKQSDEWKEGRKEYLRNHYHQNKEKYKQRREHIKEQKQQYYLKKKDDISKKWNEHFDCPCGGRYTLTHKALHCKTNKHQTYLQSLEATD